MTLGRGVPLLRHLVIGSIDCCCSSRLVEVEVIIVAVHVHLQSQFIAGRREGPDLQHEVDLDLCGVDVTDCPVDVMVLVLL